MIACILDLPAHFRTAEILAFHGRDGERLAEAVEVDRLRKGVCWNGAPACLEIRFTGQQALVTLLPDASPAPGDAEVLATLARRMLGLTQPVEQFEDTYRDHPQLGRLIARTPGLRLPLAASPFEAVTWAVTGQQISVGAAVSIRRRLIQAAGLQHSGGLYCYPGAAAILDLGEDRVRQAGFSQAKARTVLELCRRSLDGRLALDQASVPEIGRQLLDTPGIGPWTVSYTLLRGYGWLDGSLHGDVAVRRGLQALLGAAEKPGEKETERWLAPFSPWRALVAAHLWAWRVATAY